MAIHEPAIIDVEYHDLAAWQRPLIQAFGFPQTDESIAMVQALQPRVRLGVREHNDFIASLAWFDFALSVPGGATPSMASISAVSVEPTHRRRGLMRKLMHEGLERARALGLPLAGLFASDGAIYGRFGFGIASWWLDGEVPTHHAGLGSPLATRDAASSVGAIRRIDLAQALQPCASVWERVRPHVPGMLSRPDYWWKMRRFYEPAWRRQNSGPLLGFVYESEGVVEGYVLARIGSGYARGVSSAKVHITELLGTRPDVTAALWTFISQLDLQQAIGFNNFNTDHPILYLARDPARYELRLVPALYLRILHVVEALRLRSYGPGEVTLRVHDPDFAINDGCFRVCNDGVERVNGAADLELGIETLSSVYLGGQSFSALARAGKVIVQQAAALHVADRLFASSVAPWCADQF